MVPLTVAFTTFPPWKALVASMRCGVAEAFTSTVWQVTQVSVARYLPLVGPAAALAAGRSAGTTGCHSAADGWTSYGAVFAIGVRTTPGTVRRYATMAFASASVTFLNW